MRNPISFQAIDWEAVPRIEHTGDSGTAWWRTIEIDGLRLRIVEYAPGYSADHWCQKGHIVQCINGEFTSKQGNGEICVIKKGMTYVVSDNISSHRSTTQEGATLMIIDGDFLGSM